MSFVGKDVFGVLSLVICVVQYSPLIYLTWKGEKKPHVFTRLIWAIVFGVTCAAQYADHGGAGSWASGFSGILTVLIALLALRNDKSYITRGDWAAFAAALFAIPLWLMTKSALSAAVWATIIDLIAYVPMTRKSWSRPHEEMIWGCLVSDVKQLLTLAALEHYSLTTLVYPACIFVAESFIAGFLFWRRRVLARNPA